MRSWVGVFIIMCDRDFVLGGHDPVTLDSQHGLLASHHVNIQTSLASATFLASATHTGKRFISTYGAVRLRCAFEATLLRHYA